MATKKGAGDKAATPKAKALKPGEVVLTTPVERGSTSIESVVARKAQPGEMRGLQLLDIMSMDVTTMLKLLPRITTPPLTEQEVESMDTPDFIELCTEAVTQLGKRKGSLTA